MENNRYEPNDDALTACTWCGEPNLIPVDIANLFCSRLCEIEASFWFREICEVEPTHLRWSIEDPGDTL